jgi:hypothetical protein
MAKLQQGPDETDVARKFLETGHTFKMRTPDEAFKKFHREWKRFEKAEDNQEGLAQQVDGAINAAIAAWHLTDWVWKFHRAKLTKTYKVDSVSKFQAAIKAECPDLAVCDIIANAAKHGGKADDKPDRPELISVLHAEDDDSGFEARQEKGEKRWRLELKVKGKSVDPVSLFSRVFLFWFQFLQKQHELH